MDEHVAAALDAAFPDRRVRAVDPAGASWNEGNSTVAVAFEAVDRAYLKVAVDGDGRRIARERTALAYVDANCPVRVPTVLTADPEGDPPYLATAALPGRSLAAAWPEAGAEREAMVRRFGRALAAVHGERFGAHGRVVGGGPDGLDLDTDPWTDLLVDSIDEFRSVAGSDRLLGCYDEVSEAVEAQRGRLDGAPAALLHGDPSKSNVVLGEDVALIDWELARVGDPAMDLYRVEDGLSGSPRADPPDSLVEALHEGYRDRAGSLPEGYEERIPVYDAVQLLATAGHVEKAAEYHDDPVDEFAAWVREEMDRRLAAL